MNCLTVGSETQAEKPYKAPKGRSRAVSTDSARTGTSLLKVEEQSSKANLPRSESIIPRTPAPPASTSSNPAAPTPQFPQANAESSERSGEHAYPSGQQYRLATLGIGERFQGESAPASDDMLTHFNQFASRNLEPNSYPESVYLLTDSYQFASFPDDSSNLQVETPEHSVPGFYNQDHRSSPWYNSDSPYSTLPDVSRAGRSWDYRDRSVSLCSMPEPGYLPSPSSWSAPRSSSQSTSIYGRSQGLENLSEQTDESLYLSRNTSSQLATAALTQRGYNMESGSVSVSSRASKRRRLGYRPQKTMVEIERMDRYQVGWHTAAFQGQLEEYLSALVRSSPDILQLLIEVGMSIFRETQEGEGRDSLVWCGGL